MSIEKNGTLFLVPVPIGEESEWQISPEILDTIKKSRVALCERIRTTRRHIKPYLKQEEFDQIEFFELDKHNKEQVPIEVIEALESGLHVMLFSEAGCPSVADPGYKVVQAAHKRNIQVHPLVGPSSILLALMASGLQGQFFEFHGYLPKDDSELMKKLRYISQQVSKYKRTQIFMETPYRNKRLFRVMMRSIKPELSLCIAKSINTQNENIRTKRIADWKREPDPFSEKEPAIFVVGTS